MEELTRLELPVRIYAKPNEIPNAIPFQKDDVHRAYDADAVNRFWRALAQADRVFKIFRSGFIGKCSPVHLFWGAMDLAVTRFSGRPAPEHPGGIPNLPDRVTREAYSHEVSSCGFWAATAPIDYPAFYSYAYAPPAGFGDARVRPDAAFFSKDFGEFVLPYDRVRESPSPDATLLEFLQSTYVLAADLGRWDRAAMERTLSTPDDVGASMPLFAAGRRWFAAASHRHDRGGGAPHPGQHARARADRCRLPRPRYRDARLRRPARPRDVSVGLDDLSEPRVHDVDLPGGDGKPRSGDRRVGRFAAPDLARGAGAGGFVRRDDGAVCASAR